MSGAMARFTRRSLAANRVRTLVTVAGVALAAALLTAVLTTYTSLQSMLVRAEEATSGTWMAMVQQPERGPLQAQAEAALAAGEIGEACYAQDVGFGRLTDEQRAVLGQYLPLIDVSGNVGELCALRASEGRLPEAAGEVMLSDMWRTRMGVEVGDELTLPVGARRAVAADPDVDTMSGGSVDASSRYGTTRLAAGEDDWVIEDGTLLDSSIGYLDPAADGGAFTEELVDVAERTYTVVGFYDGWSYLAMNGVGQAAFTAGDPQAAGMTQAFLTVPGAGSTAEVSARVEEAFPTGHVTLHTGLLRYLGIRSGGAIWDTFFSIAAILAVVITVAGVSLIYNAFAISVAERTRQFGLLSSVGASRRQLRRAVLMEAGMVALAGIPLGLAVGIAGCAVTFWALGPALAQVFGAAKVGFDLVVAPWALAVAAGLTLATVLFSVTVPAWRASRVNVIDALRGAQASRVSRRGAARAARAVVPSRLWARRGLAGRVFGMGGQIARVNGKRTAGRGRAASVSLALAIVLLMTAGSLSLFLGTLVDAASGGELPGDVDVVAQLKPFEGDASGVGGDAGASGAADAAGDADAGAPVTLAEAEAAANAGLDAQFAVFAQAWEELCAVPNAEPVGWTVGGYGAVIVPDAMAGRALRSGDGSGNGPVAGGGFAANVSITYLDDAAFDELAAGQGLDPADFRDPAHPRALGAARAYGNDGSTYQLLDVLAGPGTVQVAVAAVCDGQVADDIGVYPVMEEGAAGGAPRYAEDAEGRTLYEVQPYRMVSEGGDRMSTVDFDLARTEVAYVPLEVAALVDEIPPLVGQGERLQLIVPASLASARSLIVTDPTFRAAFDAPEGESGTVGQALVDRLGSFIHDETPYETTFLAMNDYLGNLNGNRMLATIVNVFCLLFTVILALIALANVFNTVTNGLILRRREFAVMRSVGLSNRQFRAMIMDECAVWCLRGLVPGIVLSLGVSWLLFRSVSGSMTGMTFTLPWGYVALAFAMTAIAIAASVAYGMRRCKADSVVEALRMDNA